MNSGDHSWPQPLETELPAEGWVVFHVLFGGIPQGLEIVE